MTVVEFASKSKVGPAGWRETELAGMVGALGAGKPISGWDVGTTETGDPQFYVLAPPPDNDCVLCISRLGGTYVVEDGRGRIIGEHDSLVSLAVQTKDYLSARRRGMIARIALVWCALRQSLEQKFDAVCAEGEELLVHLAPQAAAFV